MEISHDIKPHSILSSEQTLTLLNSVKDTFVYISAYTKKPRMYYREGKWYCYVKGNLSLYTSWGRTPAEAYKNWKRNNFGRS